MEYVNVEMPYGKNMLAYERGSSDLFKASSSFHNVAQLLITSETKYLKRSAESFADSMSPNVDRQDLEKATVGYLLCIYAIFLKETRKEVDNLKPFQKVYSSPFGVSVSIATTVYPSEEKKKKVQGTIAKSFEFVETSVNSALRDFKLTVDQIEKISTEFPQPEKKKGCTIM